MKRWLRFSAIACVMLVAADMLRAVCYFASQGRSLALE